MKASFRHAAMAACLAVLMAGCTSVNRISEYQFEGKSLAVISPNAPSPAVYDELPGESASSTTDDKKKSLLASIAELATGVAKAFTAVEAQAKLDSASAQVDVATLIVDGIRDKTARYLGATASDDANAADYVVEIHIDRHGVFAGESYNGKMKYILDGEAMLLDNMTGREVWKRKIKERNDMTSGSTSTILANLDHAATLSTLTVGELTEALRVLGDEASTSITRMLSRDIEKARKK